MGTKYSPAELLAHRDQWWEHCATHPDEPIGFELDVSFKAVLRSAEVHRYRLTISYTNRTTAAHEGWKIHVYIPSFVPYTCGEFDDYDSEEIDGSHYTAFETESRAKIFPGETIKITSRDSFQFIEYEVNDSIYHKAMGESEIRWKFYTSNAPLIEGSRRLFELQDF